VLHNYRGLFGGDSLAGGAGNMQEVRVLGFVTAGAATAAEAATVLPPASTRAARAAPLTPPPHTHTHTPRRATSRTCRLARRLA
jgi:hypothetical protein